jgi:hypothetical protein
MGGGSSNSEDTTGADNAQNLESTRLVSLASALNRFSHGEYTNNFTPGDPFNTNQSGPGNVVESGYAPTITNTRANAPTETT